MEDKISFHAEKSVNLLRQLFKSIENVIHSHVADLANSIVATLVLFLLLAVDTFKRLQPHLLVLVMLSSGLAFLSLISLFLEHQTDGSQNPQRRQPRPKQ